MSAWHVLLPWEPEVLVCTVEFVLLQQKCCQPLEALCQTSKAVVHCCELVQIWVWDRGAPLGLQQLGQGHLLPAKQQQSPLHIGPQAQLHSWRSCQLQRHTSPHHEAYCSGFLYDPGAAEGIVHELSRLLHMQVGCASTKLSSWK